MAWQGKKYKSIREENYNEYLKAVGVNMILRKLALQLVPIIELRQIGDEYILSTSTVYKNLSMTFKLNEIFYEETMDGRKIKSKITKESDNKFVQSQYDDKDNELLTVTWEFSETECEKTLIYKNIVYKRWFAKVS